MTIIEMLRRSAAHFPDKPAVVQESRRISYQDFHKISRRLGSAIAEAGLKKGDRIGVMLPKSPEVIFSFLGIAMAGGVFVPLDPTPPKGNLRYVLNLTCPGMLVVSAGLYSALSDIELPCPKERIIIVGEEVPPGCLSWDRIVSGPSHAPANFAEMGENDVVYLNFTSGTTGIPKGAATTHANIFWNTLSAVESLELTREDVHLCMFPVFVHPHELFARSLFLGGTAVLVDSVYPKTIAKAVAENGVTCMMGVPAIYNALARQHETSPLRLGSLRIAESGGAFASPALVNRFNELFGIPVRPVWGSTETTGIALASPGDCTCRPTSMGKPCRHYEVKIVLDDGTQAPPGAIGMMMVKGPGVCTSYYRDVTETELHMRDGWFATGDLVMSDEEGFYYFIDRQSRMIKVAGMKVFPSEIERLIQNHPKVREVAVTKMQDRVHGEVPKAFIVLNDGEGVGKQELRRYCEEKIAGYKVPRAIEVLEELPKTPGGKILYSKLEQM